MVGLLKSFSIPTVNEDHKLNIAYSYAYNKLLKMWVLYNEQSKHKYVRVSTVYITHLALESNIFFYSSQANNHKITSHIVNNSDSTDINTYTK